MDRLLLVQPYAKKTYPFDLTTVVFKVGGKMFSLDYDHQDEIGLNLNGDPNLNLILRQQYKDLRPGYHMNKVHWNTVLINGDVLDAEIYHMIDRAYDIVFVDLAKSRIVNCSQTKNQRHKGSGVKFSRQQNPTAVK